MVASVGAALGTDCNTEHRFEVAGSALQHL